VDAERIDAAVAQLENLRRRTRLLRRTAHTWLALGSCALWLAAAPALAQHRGYNNFLVGDRALGLSGAFVGMADDASAGFHNPAGLGLLPGGSLSTSLWAAAVQLDSLSEGLESDLGRKDLDDINLVGLPFFLAVNAKLGPRGADGERRHTIAFMLVSPYNTDVTYSAQVEGTAEATGLPGVERTQIDIEDSTQWVGLSYAYRFSKKFSLGFTNFVAARFSRLHESHARVERGPVDMQAPGSTLGVNLYVDRDAYHLLWRFGALWDVDKKLRLGLMLQPPGPTVYDLTQYEVLGFVVDPDTVSTDFNAVTEGEVDVHQSMPWELRGGGTYYFNSSRHLTFDTSFIGGPHIEDSVAQAVADELGQPVSSTYARNPWTWRGAVGGELNLGTFWLLRGGLLGEVSPPPANAHAPYTVGGSFCVGIKPEGFEVALGATITHDRFGLALAQLDSASGATRLDRTDVQRTTMYFFLSGGSRAAREVAEVIGAE
jgi:long-subunit fatty acid transport protein